MSSAITTLVGLLITVLPTTQVHGQSAEPDIYERMSDLLERLTEWNESEPELHFPDVDRPLDLEAVFSGYSYDLTTSDSVAFIIAAKLPKYMGIIDSHISFYMTLQEGVAATVQHSAAAGYRPLPSLMDDTTSITLVGSTQPVAGIDAIINHQLRLYRSLGLPPLFWPHAEEPQVPVKMMFHGRDMALLEYTNTNHWLMSLRQWFRGMLVYAVPISMAEENDILELRYYLVIAMPDATSHHFLVVKEFFDTSGTTLTSTSVDVHLYPFVRVDNILSLYGTGPPTP